MSTKIVELITASVNEEAPIKIEHGNVFNSGYNSELDHLREITKNGQEWILDYQQKLVEETGIENLKIKFNKIFGYFIEINKSQANKVPEYFIRKQTLANAERFNTEELLNYQEKVLRAEEEIINLENRLFNDLCLEILKDASEIQSEAEYVAINDVFSSLAELAATEKYVKPEIISDNEIQIEKGRHPVVEKLVSDFIPNNSNFNNEERFNLLTGPNMSGKSTYLRQNAIIIYLSHIGSYVPASKAKIGLTDRIFTRVGAGDNLSKGESTFMMEMLEAASIIHNASSRSFIIFDELGRGTSTFDGLSLAWAISEHIHDSTKANCIFATHYHELIELAEKLDKAKNYSVAVIENKSSGIVFLHKIISGGASESYGIEVAKLAGIPQNIISRATELLKQLENNKNSNLQLDLFTSYESKIETKVVVPEYIQELKKLDINNLTPIQALNLLENIKSQIHD